MKIWISKFFEPLGNPGPLAGGRVVAALSGSPGPRSLVSVTPPLTQPERQLSAVTARHCCILL